MCVFIISVYDQVVEIFEQNMIVILGVLFDECSLVAAQEIVDNKEQFIVQLTQAVQEKQLVCIKVGEVIYCRLPQRINIRESSLQDGYNLVFSQEPVSDEVVYKMASTRISPQTFY